MDAAHHDLPTTTGVMLELLFCSTSRGVVELDCRAASGPGAGWPFTMRLGLPAHAAWSAAAERMLQRWADEGAVVSVDLRGGRHPAKVRISDGEAAILLDTTAAGSVFH